MTAQHVAVVGGGLSGLAAAYRLRVLMGPRVRITVVEQSGALGGKLRTAELAGTRFDVGAEAFLVRRPEAVELITELGLGEDLVHPTSGRRSTVHAGERTVPLPGRTLFGIPGDPAVVRDVLTPAGFAAVAAEPELPPIELDGGDVSVGGLLRERFGPELGARLVDPLLGGVYAGRADTLGLRATMPTLASALDRGAGSLLAAADATLPAPTSRPAPVFGTLRGGLGTLIDKLAEGSAADFRFGLPVRALGRTQSGWRLEIGSAPAPEFLDVDGVVLAVPAPAARRLLAEVAPRAAAAFADIELASTALVALALPGEVELPDASGVLIANGERHRSGTPFTAKAFTYSSRKWGHLDAGPVLVRGSVGRFGDPGQLQVDDAELVRAVRADLAELTGITAAPIDVRVTRWGGALPQYGVGHLDRVAGIERTVAGVPGLAVAGAALRGVGIPACIATGHAAAAQLAAHLLALLRGRDGESVMLPTRPTEA